MKTKKIVIGVVLGFVILSCVWLFYFLSSIKSEATEWAPSESVEIYQSAPTPGSDLDLIETDAEITIPSSAREIHALVSGFRELDTWVRFDLPADDLSLFLEGTLCEPPLVSVKPENYARDELFDPEWWQPNQAKDLLSCEGGHQYLRQRILVDRSFNEIFKVYVFSITDAFGTPTPNSQ